MTRYVDRGPSRRQRTHEAGQRGEWVALLLLVATGHRILARRYTVHGGEIDIVARRGHTILFVEVKRRPTLDQALTAITPTKLRRVSRAAAVWLARHPWAAACTLRGDSVLVVGPGWPRHVKNAFELRLGW